MKILVTGGAGFIGSNIVAELVKLDHEVVVIDNLLSGYEKNLKPVMDKIDFVLGDVRDEKMVNEKMKGVAIVFHLAASVGNKRSIDHPLRDSSINILGTLTILEAMRKNKVKKIVTSSSAAIYGELKYLPIKESHPIDPLTPYANSKLGEENHCLIYASLYDMDAVCLRYFNVYGINQQYDAYGNVIPIFAQLILNDKPITIFGDGKQTRDFVNVRDVVQANLKAAFKVGLSGSFNVASGSHMVINDLAHYMMKTANKKVEIVYRAVRPGDVLHSDADISAANKVFGYKPTVSMEEGLVEYIRWAEVNLKG